MSDRYTVINKEEPHGQSVAENGIPCTAKYCVTQLNRLSQENKELSTKETILKNKLNDLYESIDENYTETLEGHDELDIVYADAQLQLIKEIMDRVEEL
jgi:predicted transcriptional regulator